MGRRYEVTRRELRIDGGPTLRIGMSHDEVLTEIGLTLEQTDSENSRGSSVWHVHKGAVLLNFLDGNHACDSLSYIEVNADPEYAVIYKGVDMRALSLDEAAHLVSGHSLAPRTSTVADLDDDIGIWTDVGEKWNTIGIGPGDHFRKIVEQEARSPEEFFRQYGP